MDDSASTTRTDSDRWSHQSRDGQVLLSLPWEIFVLGMAIMSIANFGIIVLGDRPEIAQVVIIMDSVLVVIFAVDFVRRLGVARDDRAYLIHGYGWLDLISIIPMLRIMRLLRIMRVSRVIGRMGGSRMLRVFFANRANGGLLLVVFIAMVVMETGAIAVLWAEAGSPEALILTGQDAVWYVIVTMATVGYGDVYPVTELGRLIGSLVIVVGVGVFGTLTGYLANAFLSPSSCRDE